MWNLAFKAKCGDPAKCRKLKILEVLVRLALVDPPYTIFGIRAGAQIFAHYGEESCNINLWDEDIMLISDHRS